MRLSLHLNEIMFVETAFIVVNDMDRTNLATTIAVNFRYFIKILSYCCILEKQAVTPSDEKNPNFKTREKHLRCRYCSVYLTRGHG